MPARDRRHGEHVPPTPLRRFGNLVMRTPARLGLGDHGHVRAHGRMAAERRPRDAPPVCLVEHEGIDVE